MIFFDHQVALRGGWRSDGDSIVGHLDMERVAIGLGIDRDRRYSHPARGLDDPAGDLAAIGNQDSLEHTDLNPANRPFGFAAAARKCQ